MQISKLSMPAFGCSKCDNHRKTEQKPIHMQQGAKKMFIVSRNALIATLTGLLANCASDTYTFGVTPEGKPIIFNQDGDCIDFIPKKIEFDYHKFCEDLEDNKKPNCTLAEGLYD